MTKRFMTCLTFLWLALAGAALAAEPTLQVAADSSLSGALAEIAPLFTESTGRKVALECGDSASLASRFLEGGTADVYFPADAESLDRLREKGVVDVALARNIVVIERPGEDPAYLRAVVLTGAANRIQALAFLDFLTSETARSIFAAHGFSLP